VPVVVYPSDLHIDPTKTDSFLYGFIVVDCWFSARLPVKNQPDAILALVVL
jgi:hypothetical protein